MNRRAIPDHQNLAVDVSQQMLEEADHLRAAVAGRADVHQEASRLCQRTDGGQVVAGQWYAQNWCVPTWRVRAHLRR